MIPKPLEISDFSFDYFSGGGGNPEFMSTLDFLLATSARSEALLAPKQEVLSQTVSAFMCESI